eukprot:jgi/Bigna1/129920/aug1.10_g4628
MSDVTSKQRSICSCKKNTPATPSLRIEHFLQESKINIVVDKVMMQIPSCMISKKLLANVSSGFYWQVKTILTKYGKALQNLVDKHYNDRPIDVIDNLVSIIARNHTGYDYYGETLDETNELCHRQLNPTYCSKCYDILQIDVLTALDWNLCDLGLPMKQKNGDVPQESVADRVKRRRAAMNEMVY